MTIRETPTNEIDQAAVKAHEAFLIYRKTKPGEKMSFLALIADNIDRQRTQLSSIASRETSLPVERLETEITRTVYQLRMFVALLKDGSWVRVIKDNADPTRKPLPKPDLRLMQQPIGAVAVFGASNFPFAYSVC